MTEEANNELGIVDVALNERGSLDRILEDSFEGWYLRHSKRTLREVEVVKAAKMDDELAGLVMLKMLDEKTGYVYYIAVSKKYRGKKIAGRLLDQSLDYFFSQGANEVYAGVSEDNVESNALFRSRGFKQISYGEISKKYGNIHTLNMYRKMVIVPGEILLYKQLTSSL